MARLHGLYATRDADGPCDVFAREFLDALAKATITVGSPAARITALKSSTAFLSINLTGLMQLREDARMAQKPAL